MIYRDQLPIELINETSETLCTKIKRQMKQSYDMIVYSDKGLDADEPQVQLIRKLSANCRILFIHKHETEDAPLEIKPAGKLSILSFGKKHINNIWNKLPDFVSNTSVSAFMFFSPLYSLLKRIPCNKVIYFSDPALSNDVKKTAEPYLLNEASLVLYHIEPGTEQEIMKAVSAH